MLHLIILNVCTTKHQGLKPESNSSTSPGCAYSLHIQPLKSSDLLTATQEQLHRMVV